MLRHDPPENPKALTAELLAGEIGR